MVIKEEKRREKCYALFSVTITAGTTLPDIS